MRNAIIRIGSGLAIVAALAFMIFGSTAEGSSGVSRDDGRAPRRVRLAVVEQAPEVRARLAHGVVQAADRATLGFPMGGRLVMRTVDVGDRITTGQILGRLDAAPFQHQAANARSATTRLDAEVSQQERDTNRIGALVSSGAVSRQVSERSNASLEVARAGRASARTELQEAQRMLRDSVLRAPFDGVITAVLAEPGEVVGAGAPVIVVSGEGAREVRVEVTAPLVALLEPGTPALVDVPALGQRGLRARVRAVANGMASDGRLYPVLLSLEQSDIPTGASAEVRFETPAAPGLSIPTAAVVSPTGERASVFRVRDGLAERVDVALGSLIGDRMVVDGGLRAGDQLVVAGYVGMADGDRVEGVQ